MYVAGATVVVHRGVCGLQAGTLDHEDLLAKDVLEHSAGGDGYATFERELYVGERRHREPWRVLRAVSPTLVWCRRSTTCENKQGVGWFLGFMAGMCTTRWSA